MTPRFRLAPKAGLDAPGTQRRFVRLFLSGTHGDEYEEQVALCNLAQTLRSEAI